MAINPPSIPSIISAAQAAANAANQAASSNAVQSAAGNAAQYAQQSIALPFKPRELGNALVTVGTRMGETGDQLIGFSADLKGVAAALNDPMLTNSLQMIESNTNSIRDFLQSVAVYLRAAAGVVRANLTHLTNAGLAGMSALSQPFDNAAVSSESICNGLAEIARGVRRVKEQVPIVRTKLNDGAQTIEDAGYELKQGGADMVVQGKKLAAM